MYLFENKTEADQNKSQIKSVSYQSPLNKSVEALCKSNKLKNSSSRSKICFPVYQKYISQVKKVSTSTKLKELHKKMHSSIMNSFVSSKNENTSMNVPDPLKNSSSFVFASKSPLNSTKSVTNQNFILKNKKNVKCIHTIHDDSKAGAKLKKYKRTFSKNSIGSVNKKSSYSSSKLKNSGQTKANESSSVVKYSSFINSCKISPARTKSTERVPK